jgi:hypothetical protein
MAVTTDEFEHQLNDLLTKMEDWPRCPWCGCDARQRRTTSDSALCNSCKNWRRREQRAAEWLEAHPGRARTEQSLRIESDIEYAALCREEGQIATWKGPVTPLRLESELRTISERFAGEDVFGEGTLYFNQFSPAQRRLLLFLLEELTKVWVRHRRKRFAIKRVMEKHFPHK